MAEWLTLLRATLEGTGNEWTRLRADAAGRQVLDALWLLDAGLPDSAAAAAERWHTDLVGFTAWVESALDAATFVPPSLDEGAAVKVVIAPLARVAGRPFAHVVLPAADERHLAASAPLPGLVGPREAEALGLPTAAVHTGRQRQALAQLMRSPALTVLRRRIESGAPLAASPDLEYLWLALAAGDTPAPDEAPWLPVTERRAAAPVPRPLPSVAPERLPATLSASRIEALRACPYRFFARAVLGLEEADELADPLSKRDYGNWLHELLLQFHRQRAAAGSAPAANEDVARLHAAADAAAAELGLGADELLPFRASFDAFVPAYLRWLHEREAAGWHWSEGETAREVAPPRTRADATEGRDRSHRPWPRRRARGARLQGRRHRRATQAGARAARGHATRGVRGAAAARGPARRGAAGGLRGAGRCRRTGRRGTRGSGAQRADDAAAPRRGAGAHPRRRGTARARRGTLQLLRGARPVPARPLGRSEMNAEAYLIASIEPGRGACGGARPVPARPLGRSEMSAEAYLIASIEPGRGACEARGLCRRDYWGEAK
ncbi:MAG: PD-(D/E)XK nuclease family protein [Rubrivivax sp.]